MPDIVNQGKHFRHPNRRPHLRRDLGLLQSTVLAITDMTGIGPFITIPFFLLRWAASGDARVDLGRSVGLLRRSGMGGVGRGQAQGRGSYNYLREAFGPHSLGRRFSLLVVWQIVFSARLSVATGSIGFFVRAGSRLALRTK